MSRKLIDASPTARIYVIAQDRKLHPTSYWRKRWFGKVEWTGYIAEATRMTLAEANATLSKLKLEKPELAVRVDRREL